MIKSHNFWMVVFSISLVINIFYPVEDQISNNNLILLIMVYNWLIIGTVKDKKL